MRRRITKLLLAAALVSLGRSNDALAQSTPNGAGGPDAPGASQTDAVTPPILRSRADATYPPQALRDRLEATVGLAVTVDDTGAVAEAHVTAPAGHGFDEAALAAARRFTFEPARRNGVAIRSTIQFAYEFHPPAPVAPVPAPEAATVRPAPVPAPIQTQQGPDQSTLVLARRPFIRIGAPRERNAASDSSMDQAELSLRPRFRAEGLQEVVPGLFSVQHAGEGRRSKTSCAASISITAPTWRTSSMGSPLMPSATRTARATPTFTFSFPKRSPASTPPKARTRPTLATSVPRDR